MREAITTSLLATIFAATAAVIIYWCRGDILCLHALAESSIPDLLISEISGPVGYPVVPVFNLNLDLTKFAVWFVVAG